MHPTTAELFAETLQKTGFWLEELMQELGTSQPQRAYSVLRAVLHVLRDRLTAEEAADLGAQLPTLIRGFYYDGWRPTAQPLKYRDKEDCLRRVAQLYPGLAGSDCEDAVRAVFRLLAGHVTRGEIHDVKHQLPPELRTLWEAPHLP